MTKTNPIGSRPSLVKGIAGVTILAFVVTTILPPSRAFASRGPNSAPIDDRTLRTQQTVDAGLESELLEALGAGQEEKKLEPPQPEIASLEGVLGHERPGTEQVPPWVFAFLAHAPQVGDLDLLPQEPLVVTPSAGELGITQIDVTTGEAHEVPSPTEPVDTPKSNNSFWAMRNGPRRSAIEWTPPVIETAQKVTPQVNFSSARTSTPVVPNIQEAVPEPVTTASVAPTPSRRAFLGGPLFKAVTRQQTAVGEKAQETDPDLGTEVTRRDVLKATGVAITAAAVSSGVIGADTLQAQDLPAVLAYNGTVVDYNIPTGMLAQGNSIVMDYATGDVQAPMPDYLLTARGMVSQPNVPKAFGDQWKQWSQDRLEQVRSIMGWKKGIPTEREIWENWNPPQMPGLVSYVVWGPWEVDKELWVPIFQGLRKGAGVGPEKIHPEPHTRIYLDPYGAISHWRPWSVSELAQLVVEGRKQGVEVVYLMGDPSMVGYPSAGTYLFRNLRATKTIIPDQEGINHMAWDIELRDLDEYTKLTDDDKGPLWNNIFSVIAKDSQEKLSTRFQSAASEDRSDAEVTVFIPYDFPELAWRLAHPEDPASGRQGKEPYRIEIPTGIHLVTMNYSNRFRGTTDLPGVVDMEERIVDSFRKDAALPKDQQLFNGVTHAPAVDIGPRPGYSGETFWQPAPEEGKPYSGKLSDRVAAAFDGMDLIHDGSPGVRQERVIHTHSILDLLWWLRDGGPTPAQMADREVQEYLADLGRPITRTGKFLSGRPPKEEPLPYSTYDQRDSSKKSGRTAWLTGQRLVSGATGAGSVWGHFDTLMHNLQLYHPGGGIYANPDMYPLGAQYGGFYIVTSRLNSLNFGSEGRIESMKRTLVDPSRVGGAVPLQPGEEVQVLVLKADATIAGKDWPEGTVLMADDQVPGHGSGGNLDPTIPVRRDTATGDADGTVVVHGTRLPKDVRHPHGMIVAGRQVLPPNEGLVHHEDDAHRQNDMEVIQMETNAYDFYWTFTVHNTGEEPIVAYINLRPHSGYGEALDLNTDPIKLEKKGDEGERDKGSYTIALRTGYDDFSFYQDGFLQYEKRPVTPTLVTPTGDRWNPDRTQAKGRFLPDVPINEEVLLINEAAEALGDQRPLIMDAVGLPALDMFRMAETLRNPRHRNRLRQEAQAVIDLHQLSIVSHYALDRPMMAQVTLEKRKDLNGQPDPDGPLTRDQLDEPGNLVTNVAQMKGRDGVTYMAVESEDLYTLVEKYMKRVEGEEDADGVEIRPGIRFMEGSAEERSLLSKELANAPEAVRLRRLLYEAAEAGIKFGFSIDWKRAEYQFKRERLEGDIEEDRDGRKAFWRAWASLTESITMGLTEDYFTALSGLGDLESLDEEERSDLKFLAQRYDGRVANPLLFMDGQTDAELDLGAYFENHGDPDLRAGDLKVLRVHDLTGIGDSGELDDALGEDRRQARQEGRPLGFAAITLGQSNNLSQSGILAEAELLVETLVGPRQPGELSAGGVANPIWLAEQLIEARPYVPAVRQIPLSSLGHEAQTGENPIGLKTTKKLVTGHTSVHVNRKQPSSTRPFNLKVKLLNPRTGETKTLSYETDISQFDANQPIKIRIDQVPPGRYVLSAELTAGPFQKRLPGQVQRTNTPLLEVEGEPGFTVVNPGVQYDMQVGGQTVKVGHAKPEVVTVNGAPIFLQEHWKVTTESGQTIHIGRDQSHSRLIYWINSNQDNAQQIRADVAGRLHEVPLQVGDVLLTPQLHGSTGQLTLVVNDERERRIVFSSLMDQALEARWSNGVSVRATGGTLLATAYPDRPIPTTLTPANGRVPDRWSASRAMEMPITEVDTTAERVQPYTPLWAWIGWGLAVGSALWVGKDYLRAGGHSMGRFSTAWRNAGIRRKDSEEEGQARQRAAVRIQARDREDRLPPRTETPTQQLVSWELHGGKKLWRIFLATVKFGGALLLMTQLPAISAQLFQYGFSTLSATLIKAVGLTLGLSWLFRLFHVADPVDYEKLHRTFAIPINIVRVLGTVASLAIFGYAGWQLVTKGLSLTIPWLGWSLPTIPPLTSVAQAVWGFAPGTWFKGLALAGQGLVIVGVIAAFSTGVAVVLGWHSEMGRGWPAQGRAAVKAALLPGLLTSAIGVIALGTIGGWAPALILLAAVGVGMVVTLLLSDLRIRLGNLSANSLAPWGLRAGLITGILVFFGAVLTGGWGVITVGSLLKLGAAYWFAEKVGIRLIANFLPQAAAGSLLAVPPLIGKRGDKEKAKGWARFFSGLLNENPIGTFFVGLGGVAIVAKLPSILIGTQFPVAQYLGKVLGDLWAAPEAAVVMAAVFTAVGAFRIVKGGYDRIGALIRPYFSRGEDLVAHYQGEAARAVVLMYGTAPTDQAAPDRARQYIEEIVLPAISQAVAEGEIKIGQGREQVAAAEDAVGLQLGRYLMQHPFQPPAMTQAGLEGALDVVQRKIELRRAKQGAEEFVENNRDALGLSPVQKVPEEGNPFPNLQDFIDARVTEMEQHRDLENEDGVLARALKQLKGSKDYEKAKKIAEEAKNQKTLMEVVTAMERVAVALEREDKEEMLEEVRLVTDRIRAPETLINGIDLRWQVFKVLLQMDIGAQFATEPYPGQSSSTAAWWATSISQLIQELMADPMKEAAFPAIVVLPKFEAGQFDIGFQSGGMPVVFAAQSMKYYSSAGVRRLLSLLPGSQPRCLFCFVNSDMEYRFVEFERDVEGRWAKHKQVLHELLMGSWRHRDPDLFNMAEYEGLPNLLYAITQLYSSSPDVAQRLAANLWNIHPLKNFDYNLGEASPLHSVTLELFNAKGDLGELGLDPEEGGISDAMVLGVDLEKGINPITPGVGVIRLHGDMNTDGFHTPNSLSITTVGEIQIDNHPSKFYFWFGDPTKDKPVITKQKPKSARMVILRFATGRSSLEPRVKKNGGIALKESVPWDSKPAADFLEGYKEVLEERRERGRKTRGFLHDLHERDWFQKGDPSAAGLEAAERFSWTREGVVYPGMPMGWAINPKQDRKKWRLTRVQVRQGLYRLADILPMARWAQEKRIWAQGKRVNEIKVSFWSWTHWRETLFGFIAGFVNGFAVGKFAVAAGAASTFLGMATPLSAALIGAAAVTLLWQWWSSRRAMAGFWYKISPPVYMAIYSFVFLQGGWIAALGYLLLSRYFLDVIFRQVLSVVLWGFRNDPLVSSYRYDFDPTSIRDLAERATGSRFQPVPEEWWPDDMEREYRQQGWDLLTEAEDGRLYELVVELALGESGQRYLDNPRMPEEYWEQRIIENIRPLFRETFKDKTLKEREDRQKVMYAIEGIIKGYRAAALRNSELIEALHYGTHNRAIPKQGDVQQPSMFFQDLEGHQTAEERLSELVPKNVSKEIHVYTRSWGRTSPASAIGSVRVAALEDPLKVWLESRPSRSFMHWLVKEASSLQPDADTVDRSTARASWQIMHGKFPSELATAGLEQDPTEAVHRLQPLKRWPIRLVSPEFWYSGMFHIGGKPHRFPIVDAVLYHISHWLDQIPIIGRPLNRALGAAASVGIGWLALTKLPHLLALAVNPILLPALGWVVVGILGVASIMQVVYSFGPRGGNTRERVIGLGAGIGLAAAAGAAFIFLVPLLSTLSLPGIIAYAIGGSLSILIAFLSLQSFRSSLHSVDGKEGFRLDEWTNVEKGQPGDGIRSLSLIPGFFSWVISQLVFRFIFRVLSYVTPTPFPTYSWDAHMIARSLGQDTDMFSGFVHNVSWPFWLGPVPPALPYLNLTMWRRSATKWNAGVITALDAERLANEPEDSRGITEFNWGSNGRMTRESHPTKAHAEDTYKNVGLLPVLLPATPAVSLWKTKKLLMDYYHRRFEEGALTSAMDFKKGMGMEIGKYKLRGGVEHDQVDTLLEQVSQLPIEEQWSVFTSIKDTLEAYHRNEIATPAEQTGAGVYDRLFFTYTGGSIQYSNANAAFSGGEPGAHLWFLVFAFLDREYNGAIARQMAQMQRDAGYDVQIPAGGTLMDQQTRLALAKGTFLDPQLALAAVWSSVEQEMGIPEQLERLTADEYTRRFTQIINGNVPILSNTETFHLSRTEDLRDVKLTTIHGISWAMPVEDLSLGGQRKLASGQFSHLNSANQILDRYGKTGVILASEDVKIWLQPLVRRPVGSPPHSPFGVVEEISTAGLEGSVDVVPSPAAVQAVPPGGGQAAVVPPKQMGWSHPEYILQFPKDGHAVLVALGQQDRSEEIEARENYRRDLELAKAIAEQMITPPSHFARFFIPFGTRGRAYADRYDEIGSLSHSQMRARLLSDRGTLSRFLQEEHPYFEELEQEDPDRFEKAVDQLHALGEFVEKREGFDRLQLETEKRALKLIQRTYLTRPVSIDPKQEIRTQQVSDWAEDLAEKLLIREVVRRTSGAPKSLRSSESAGRFLLDFDKNPNVMDLITYRGSRLGVPFYPSDLGEARENWKELAFPFERLRKEIMTQGVWWDAVLDELARKRPEGEEGEEPLPRLPEGMIAALAERIVQAFDPDVAVAIGEELAVPLNLKTRDAKQVRKRQLENKPIGFSHAAVKKAKELQALGYQVTVVAPTLYGAEGAARLVDPHAPGRVTVVGISNVGGQLVVKPELSSDPEFAQEPKKAADLLKRAGKVITDPRIWPQVQTVLMKRGELQQQIEEDEAPAPTAQVASVRRQRLKWAAVVTGAVAGVLGGASVAEAPTVGIDFADGMGDGFDLDFLQVGELDIEPLVLDVAKVPTGELPVPTADLSLFETLEPTVSLEIELPEPLLPELGEPMDLAPEIPSLKREPLGRIAVETEVVTDDLRKATGGEPPPEFSWPGLAYRVSSAKQLTKYFADSEGGVGVKKLPAQKRPVFSFEGPAAVDGTIWRQRGTGSIVLSKFTVAAPDPMVVTVAGRRWRIPANTELQVRMDATGTTVSGSGVEPLYWQIKGAKRLQAYLTDQIHGSDRPDGFSLKGDGTILVGGTVKHLTLVPQGEPLTLTKEGADGSAIEVSILPNQRLSLDLNVKARTMSINWEKTDQLEPVIPVTGQPPAGTAGAGPGPGAGGPPLPPLPESVSIPSLDLDLQVQPPLVASSAPVQRTPADVLLAQAPIARSAVPDLGSPGSTVVLPPRVASSAVPDLGSSGLTVVLPPRVASSALVQRTPADVLLAQAPIARSAGPDLGSPGPTAPPTAKNVSWLRELERQILLLQGEESLLKELFTRKNLERRQKMLPQGAASKAQVERATALVAEIPIFHAQSKLTRALGDSLVQASLEDYPRLWQERLEVILGLIAAEREKLKTQVALLDISVDRATWLIPRGSMSPIDGTLREIRSKKAQIRRGSLDDISGLYDALGSVGARGDLPVPQMLSTGTSIRDYSETVAPPVTKLGPPVPKELLENVTYALRGLIVKLLAAEQQILELDKEWAEALYQVGQKVYGIDKGAIAKVELLRRSVKRALNEVISAKQWVLEVQKDRVLAGDPDPKMAARARVAAQKRVNEAILQQLDKMIEYRTILVDYRSDLLRIEQSLLRAQPKSTSENAVKSRELHLIESQSLLEVVIHLRRFVRELNDLGFGLPNPESATVLPGLITLGSPSPIDPPTVPSLINIQELVPVSPVELPTEPDESEIKDAVKRIQEAHQGMFAAEIKRVQTRIGFMELEIARAKKIMNLDPGAISRSEYEDALEQEVMIQTLEAKIEILRAEMALIDDRPGADAAYEQAVQDQVRREDERIQLRLSFLEGRLSSMRKYRDSFTDPEREGMEVAIEDLKSRRQQLALEQERYALLKYLKHPFGSPENPTASLFNPESLKHRLGSKEPSLAPGYVRVLEEGKWQLKPTPASGHVWISRPIIVKNRYGLVSYVKDKDTGQFVPEERLVEIAGDFAQFRNPQDEDSIGTTEVVVGFFAASRESQSGWFYVPGGIQVSGTRLGQIIPKDAQGKPLVDPENGEVLDDPATGQPYPVTHGLVGHVVTEPREVPQVEGPAKSESVPTWLMVRKVPIEEYIKRDEQGRFVPLLLSGEWQGEMSQGKPVYGDFYIAGMRASDTQEGTDLFGDDKPGQRIQEPVYVDEDVRKIPMWLEPRIIYDPTSKKLLPALERHPLFEEEEPQEEELEPAAEGQGAQGAVSPQIQAPGALLGGELVRGIAGGAAVAGAVSAAAGGIAALGAMKRRSAKSSQAQKSAPEDSDEPDPTAAGLEGLIQTFRDLAETLVPRVRWELFDMGQEVADLTGTAADRALRRMARRDNLQVEKLLAVPTTDLPEVPPPQVIWTIYVPPQWREQVRENFRGDGRYQVVGEAEQDQADAQVVASSAGLEGLLALGKILFQVKNGEGARLITPGLIDRLTLKGVIRRGIGTLVVIQRLLYQDLKEVALIFA